MNKHLYQAEVIQKKYYNLNNPDTCNVIYVIKLTFYFYLILEKYNEQLLVCDFF